ncbi:MAG: LysM peptidoglycan-binding domain-containing protein [Anaerolineae bacterium]|nr:LysM peptidoglycan-binding domain-containing protein [Anaerolineae bacterium]
MKSPLHIKLLLAVVVILLLGFAQSVMAAPAASAGGWEILGDHTVLYGETLYCIGRAYGVDPWAIATQNNVLVPDLIHPGAVLSIPNVPATLPPGPVCAQQFGDAPDVVGDAPDAAGDTPAEPASCGGCVCRVTHTIRWGETLSYISINYGVDMWSIAQCNCIYNVNYIRAGASLCIP